MILVDSSAFIEYYRPKGVPAIQNAVRSQRKRPAGESGTGRYENGSESAPLPAWWGEKWVAGRGRLVRPGGT
jgi:hypothetical protein